MSHADFVHLRVHSAYSLSEGAIPVKKLIGLCQDQAMPAVAVTDTNNLFGCLDFAFGATGAGLQPIVGTQLNLTPPDVDSQNRAPAPDQLVLLVQDETGYGHVMALLSRAFLDTPPGLDPQVSLDDLDGRTDGLICLTGGVAGPVGRLLAAGQRDRAEAVLDRLAGLFAGRLYVELQRHGLAEEDRIEDALIDLAYARDLPLVATNDAYFADADLFEPHDALLCIAQGTTLADDNRRRLTREHRFKTAAEMRDLFADLPEAVDNTLVIARRCHYVPPKVPPILPTYTKLDGRSEEEALRDMAAQGLGQRLDAHVFTADMDDARRKEIAAPYWERLDFELKIIVQMGFPGYFLIVADFIQWAKSQGIPVGPGRGSGAGSLVAYALQITDLDPLRWGLLFERFLNPERVSMPDFDVDFCQDRRDEVIQYVQGEYGADRVAQIITFGKLQARAVLRDVGRVLGLPYGQVDRICKLVPNNPAKPTPLAQAIEEEPRLKEAMADENVAEMIKRALPLEGLYRHASTHAAGVVIGDRPLEQLVPLYRDPRSDMPVTQFNMKFVEQAGLVKFDFLGLKTLTVLITAVELLSRRHISIDLSAIPLDDRKTFDLLAKGDTTGVFQLESAGMRDVLRKLKPDRFEDIIAVVALYRPGPMDNIPSYIRRKHGEEEPEYLHELLEPVLKETFGIPIYQEQVMQIAQVLSGYSLGQADLLRRAMGKKIQEEMDKQRATFVEGAEKNGVARKTADLIFDQVNKFAGYGFNKSHAAAYALVAYQTAFLKANHPVEFLAASMTLDLGNTDKLNNFRQELVRQNIPLLPPDINASEDVFTVDPDQGAIRYALAAVKGVGAQAMGDLVAERQARGPFKDLFDLAERLDTKVVNKRLMEHLVCAGAFDSVDSNRARAFAAIDTLIRFSARAAEERASTQSNLFAASGPAARPRLPDPADWDIQERLKREFEAIGFYLSAHPLDAYRQRLDRLGVVQAATVADRLRQGGGSRVRLAGIPLGRREMTSARGNRFAFVQLSDGSGSYEVTLWAETLAAARDLLDENMPVVVTADAQLNEDEVRLVARSVESLEQAVAGACQGLRVTVDDARAVPDLKAVIAQQEGRGRGRICLVVRPAGREVEMALPGGYGVTPAVAQAIQGIRGVAEVHDI